MKKPILLILPLIALPLVGCVPNLVKATGKVIEKEYLIDEDATKLSIKDILIKDDMSSYYPEVTLYEDGDKKVVFTYEESLAKEIKVNANEGLLSISGNKNKRFISDGVKIDIYGFVFDDLKLDSCHILDTNKALNKNYVKVDINDAAIFEEEFITTKKMEVNVSSASSFDVMHINTETFSLNVKNASKVEIDDLLAIDATLNAQNASKLYVKDGIITNLNSKVESAAKADLKGIKVVKANIDVSGASNASYQASELVSGKVSGASSVDLYGGAPTKLDVTGASKVTNK